MFKEIKKQYLLSVEDLDKTKQEKKAVKAMLEEKRKKDEEEFLEPVLKQESERKKVLEDKKKALLVELSKGLQAFSKSQTKQVAEELLESFVFVLKFHRLGPNESKKEVHCSANR